MNTTRECSSRVLKIGPYSLVERQQDGERVVGHRCAAGRARTRLGPGREAAAAALVRGRLERPGSPRRIPAARGSLDSARCGRSAGRFGERSAAIGAAPIVRLGAAHRLNEEERLRWHANRVRSGARSSRSPAAPAGSARRPRGRWCCKGAKVAIGDLDRELAEQTAAEIGGETLALELDVTRRDSFEGFLDQVEERLGSLDVLINNAGIMPLGKLRRRGRRDRAPDGRHQRARRDVRDEAGAAADAAPRQRPPRQPRLAGGQGRVPGRRHLLRHQALRRRRLRGGPRRAARHRDRDLGA